MNVYTEEEFRNWILSRKHTGYTCTCEQDKILLYADRGTGSIVFYEDSIVEMMIETKEEKSPAFYLHFQLSDEEHAVELYLEMEDTLCHLHERKKYRVLLSCTSALTTSYFASELTNGAEQLGLDYEFNAVPYQSLYEMGFEYDAILLAPQIHHQYKNIAEIFSDRLVMKIPAAIFGQYKTGALIESIIEEKNSFESRRKEDPKPLTIAESDYRILTIALLNHKDMYHLAYRIYDHGTPTLNKEVVKKTISKRDVEDLLEYILIRHKAIDAVSIAVPGITYHGQVYYPEMGFMNESFGIALSEKYNKPVIILNDVNAMTLGYHHEHPDDNNMVFFFQPRGRAAAGAGILIDGKLHRGWKHGAGEVGQLINTFVEDAEKKINDPEGALEIVSAGIAMMISAVSPEKTAVFCDLIPEMEELHRSLCSIINEEFIPELVKVDSVEPYILSGALIHCMEVFGEMPEWVNQNSNQKLV